MMFRVTDDRTPQVPHRHSAFGFVMIAFGALTVFESIYAATLNVTAAVVAAGALAGAAAVSVIVLRRSPAAGHQSTASTGDEPSRRRAGWPSRVFALICAFFAFGTLGGLSSRGLSTQAKGGLVALAVALVLLALDVATGRLAADVRRLRLSVRGEPRLAGALYGSILGACLLGFIGFGGFVSIDALRTDGARAPALITNVTHFRTSTYFLRYVTTSGRTVTCSTENVKGTPAPGSYITVLYERHRPSLNCEDARLGTSFVVPIVLSAVSVALLVAARWVYLRARRSQAGPVGRS